MLRLAIDWQYWWYEDVTVRFGWPGTDWVWPLTTGRLCVWLIIASIVTAAAIFAAVCWQVWRGPVTLIDSGSR